MREMISLVYLTVMHAPPPKDWKGVGRTIAQICNILNLSANQRQRIENVIANTHFTYLTGAEYDPARFFGNMADKNIVVICYSHAIVIEYIVVIECK